MCTYDYTPYTGCRDGEQHFYIQWVKCKKAVQTNKYCTLEGSTKLEHLSKLSSNVLSCPIHGLVAVQQPLLDSLPLATVEELGVRDSSDGKTGGARVRTKAHHDLSISKDTPHEQLPRRDRDPWAAGRRESESSDSESSSRIKAPSRAVDEGLSAHGVPRKRSTPPTREKTHRRARSADLSVPSSQPSSVHHTHSKVLLQRRAESETQEQETQPVTKSTTKNATSRPKQTLDIPIGPGKMGLPASPDVHRLANELHRSKSEALLRDCEEPQSKPDGPTEQTTGSSDGSPDHNSELPFSNGPPCRGRRSGSSSMRNRSVDTSMRRIYGNAVPEEDEEEPLQTQRPELARGPSVVPQPKTASPIERMRGSGSTQVPFPKPASRLARHEELDTTRLSSLQIPERIDGHQRPVSRSSATSSPGQDKSRPSFRSIKSLRYGGAPYHTRVPEEIAFLSSFGATRFDGQIDEGHIWAAANEHMSSPSTSSGSPKADNAAHAFEPNQAPSSSGRESVDSGYLSGHQQQPQRGGKSPTASAVGLGITGLTVGHKGGNSSLPCSQHGQDARDGPVPEIQNLNGLPPCALPVSLASLPSETVGKGGKTPLLQRMGLKKKISGLWERGGQKEIGAIEG
ncbi:hypothetical protein N656DRAFT_95696 [Canariomyces notabilis]|uniref:Uncharacterized protein n=1 Tax=Canariomyces notabilis TaxID=2074819 RepID=A0AAN6TDR7_9PEZI|nr:hypothetical protein N656DRAFT_95696 [Canariomyces arenarius]